MFRPVLRAGFVSAALVLALTVPVLPGSALEVAPPEVEVEVLEGLPELSTEGDTELSLVPPTVEEPEEPADAPVRLSAPIETPIPFSMVGFELPDGVEQIEARARVEGAWTEWFETELQDIEEGPDPDTAEFAGADEAITRLTDPLWMGEADALQIRLPGDGDPTEVRATLIDSLGMSEGLVTRVTRHLTARPAAVAEADTAAPRIRTRAQWGADESIRKGSPSYAANARYVVIHHTAGGNNYTQAQADGVVRGIYSWHVNGNGWSDVGYQFMVDKFGTIYEGRFGGVDRAVIGAHAGGWNTGSFGVSLLGNYNDATPTSAAMRSFASLIAWKYRVHGIDPSPSARTVANNQTIPTLVGHRNVRGSTYQANPSTTTDCPGQNFYVRLGTLRNNIDAAYAAAASIPVPAGAIPVTGDWNGDGRTDPGYFHNGRWYLRTSTTAGPVESTASFGRSGDVPVVGDWNGDGRDSVGIVRDNYWHLRDVITSGRTDHSFAFGRITRGDVPLVGDWNRSGRDTIGIVRGGTWHLRNSLSGGNAQHAFVYGRVVAGDVPVIGDWNGNGHVGVGIVRDGTWHLRHSLSGGNANLSFRYGRATGDVPVVGDWSGDRTTTVGVVRDRTWMLLNRNSGGSAGINFLYR